VSSKTTRREALLSLWEEEQALELAEEELRAVEKELRKLSSKHAKNTRTIKRQRNALLCRHDRSDRD
jgi:hypothetical protein